ncbi:MAG: type II secretion system minor pseudopilin GspK [Panacagrimonas sp.]
MALPARQRGIALITAVLVVSLSVIAATAVLDAGHFAIQRTSTVQDSEKAWGYATGAEDWVRTILQRDADDNDYDGLDEPWTLPQTLPIENGVITGEIVDATSRFNLNNLGLSQIDGQPCRQGVQQGQPGSGYCAQVALFSRLIESLEGGNTLIPDIQVLADTIRDWIDADQEPTGSGREDVDYLSLDPPRRAANRPMVSVTELRTVLDVMFDNRTDDARKVYLLLLPQVTVLPVDGVTPINVNTATPELLRALSPNPGEALQQFIELRKEEPKTQINDVSELVPGTGDYPANLLEVSTKLFLLRAQAVVGNGRVALYSLIYRPDQGTPVVLSRSTDTE